MILQSWVLQIPIIGSRPYWDVLQGTNGNWVIHDLESSYIIIWEFPTMLVPNNYGFSYFPTKNDHFGVFWGYHHFRKHPYDDLESSWLHRSIGRYCIGCKSFEKKGWNKPTYYGETITSSRTLYLGDFTASGPHEIRHHQTHHHFGLIRLLHFFQAPSFLGDMMIWPIYFELKTHDVSWFLGSKSCKSNTK